MPFSLFLRSQKFHLRIIQYLIDGAEDGVGHMIVDHDGRDEYLVEIDSVGPQSLVNRIRLVIFGRRWTTGASFRSISACFCPGNAQQPAHEKKTERKRGK